MSGIDPGRRGLLALLALSAFPGRPAAAEGARPGPGPFTPRANAADFDAAWRAVDRRYAYFDRGRGGWRRAGETWKPHASRARGRDELIAALEGLLAQLRDDHAGLVERAADSPRRIPAESDIWARFRDGAAIVEAVRIYGDADAAGLRPGHVVARIDAMPVEQAVRRRLGAGHASRAAHDWALRHALAGPRAGIVRLVVREGARERALEIERRDAPPADGPPLLTRRVGDDRELGYIRLKRGLGDARVVERFDAALDELADTRAMMLDLRDVSAPGPHAVTQALIGRFIASEAPWQLRAPPGGRRVTDMASPRGTPYRAPLVVLVDRWTASEGEALAAGLHAAAGARLVGTAMAGMRGELAEVKLPHSGLTLRFPSQRAFSADGTPRELLRPAVEVDLAAPQGGPGDPILYQGLKLLQK